MVQLKSLSKHQILSMSSSRCLKPRAAFLPACCQYSSLTTSRAFALRPHETPASSPFSTSQPHHARQRGRKDNNPNRGVSPLRRTGLRFPLSVSNRPLPKPVLDPQKRSRPQGTEDHGLWGFFNEARDDIQTPKADFQWGKCVGSLAAAALMV